MARKVNLCISENRTEGVYIRDMFYKKRNINCNLSHKEGEVGVINKIFLFISGVSFHNINYFISSVSICHVNKSIPTQTSESCSFYRASRHYHVLAFLYPHNTVH